MKAKVHEVAMAYREKHKIPKGTPLPEEHKVNERTSKAQQRQSSEQRRPRSLNDTPVLCAYTCMHVCG